MSQKPSKPFVDEGEPNAEIEQFRAQFRAMLKAMVSKGHDVDHVAEAAEDVLQQSWD